MKSGKHTKYKELPASTMVDEQAVLVVAAGDVKIDNPKYKAEFGKKAKMLSRDEVEKYSQYDGWVDVCKGY